MQLERQQKLEGSRKGAVDTSGRKAAGKGYFTRIPSVTYLLHRSVAIFAHVPSLSIFGIIVYCGHLANVIRRVNIWYPSWNLEVGKRSHLCECEEMGGGNEALFAGCTKVPPSLLPLFLVPLSIYSHSAGGGEMEVDRVRD